MYPLNLYLRPDYPIQSCSDNAYYENNEDGCNVPQVDQGASAREDLDINGPHWAPLLGLSVSKSSGRNSSGSLLPQTLHKIYYILLTLRYYKYSISVALVVLMVVDVIFLNTYTCTCPAKEQAQVLQVLQEQALQVQVPAQQGGERELSRKCVLSSDYSLLPSSLPAPEADHDENYVYYDHMPQKGCCIGRL